MIWAIAKLYPEFWCPGWLLGSWSVIRNTRVVTLRKKSFDAWLKGSPCQLYYTGALTGAYKGKGSKYPDFCVNVICAWPLSALNFGRRQVSSECFFSRVAMTPSVRKVKNKRERNSCLDQSYPSIHQCRLRKHRGRNGQRKNILDMHDDCSWWVVVLHLWTYS